MNIALPIGIFLLLLLPGLIFQKAATRTENTQIERKPLTVMSTQAFGWAVILNFCAVWSIEKFTYFSVNYDIWIKLITSVQLDEKEIEAAANSFHWFLIYLCVVYLLSRLCGFVFFSIRRRFTKNQDSLLAFDTPWFYEFKGEVSNAGKACLIKFSCIQDIGGTAVIYRGILEDFYFAPDGQLDRVVISNCSKKEFKSDINCFKNESSDELGSENVSVYQGFLNLKSDRFVLKYSEMKNISFHYIYIEKC